MMCIKYDNDGMVGVGVERMREEMAEESAEGGGRGTWAGGGSRGTIKI